MELKNYNIRFIKIGSRFAQIIQLKAEDEKSALKLAEEKLGARYGIISATCPDDEKCEEQLPTLIPGTKP